MGQEDQPDVGDSRLVVFEEGRATRDVGDELEFGLSPSGLRYFDAESGSALSVAK